MPFADLVGHAPVVDLLRRAVARGRVPQSLLFAGPEGVGKRAVAVALAQAVNCPAQRDGDACGRCAVCTRIARGQFSDVTLLDRGDEASIKIKPLRARVLVAVHYRPVEGRRRVYIIDPADALTDEAQDALL
jgi:DNA polymerase III gamma/tau subunit